MELETSRFWCSSFVANDTLGRVLADVSMLPYFVILHTASRCYSRRDVHEALTLVGLVANEVLARGLKHLLRQPRPAERCSQLDTCDSWGMPSSHAQCMFFALALQAAIVASHARLRSRASAAVAAAELAAMALGALAVAFSRVYLKYHSLDQVLLGAVLGLVFGLAWSGLMAALAPLYASVSASRLGQLLHLKDTWGEPEPLQLERAALRASSEQKKRH